VADRILVIDHHSVRPADGRSDQSSPRRNSSMSAAPDDTLATVCANSARALVTRLATSSDPARCSSCLWHGDRLHGGAAGLHQHQQSDEHPAGGLGRRHSRCRRHGDACRRRLRPVDRCGGGLERDGGKLCDDRARARCLCDRSAGTGLRRPDRPDQRLRHRTPEGARSTGDAVDDVPAYRACS
jgi:hypothetical protein